MWLDGPPRVDQPLPIWQHGKRVHGYWLGTQRMGHVGLTPRGFGPVEYSWGIDADMRASGSCATLREAKRAVERAFRELYSWRFPASH
jgi:hypothetical protein